MFELKKELEQKVSSKIKSQPHYLALLDYIINKEINSKEHLASYLGQEVALVESWLKENKQVGAKTMREKVTHLEVLKKCQGLTKEFLE
ncbi:hypothetical protein HYU21_05080 [Candidatus Woesearchaeota archaeon]|nr:hypothetical protein [Candidatus Woesearchaeota archaeon]